MKPFRVCLVTFALAAGLSIHALHAEVLLQYFETEWDEIYRRLPEMSEIGYEGLWTPPPCKSPHAGGPYAGGGNVGYSHFDKFDIGDVPQRGSFATRYGTRNSLRNLVDNAHGCDIKVYPDIVMNHFGNGPDYRTYPGTKPNDFHGWFDGGQPGGFKRSARMTNYGEINNGFGRTFQEELVSLIDLQLEADQRFSTGSPNFATPPSFNRQPGQDEYYPYGPNSNESTIQFINRWIAWLGNAMDFDGVRLDAPKHVIADFFGTPGFGFNHEIQFNFDSRRGLSDVNEFDELYLNYIRRDDALIFSEFFIGGVGEVDYWRNFNGTGVKMRYLDFPRKSSMIFPAFNSGNLAALSGFSGFSDQEGVLFCQSHDESPPSKLELAYVYIMTHVGLPVVYFTGNNLSGADVNVKTWLKIGHGGALGDYSNSVLPNLTYIHNHFARGREWERWSEGDFYAYERYDEITTNAFPDANEALLLVGLNDSGSWQTRNGVQTAFAAGTLLHDYAGNNPTDLTVDGNRKVNLSIPPGVNGQGWVCYAPYNATGDGDPLRFNIGGSLAPTMTWIVPGGALTTNKTRQVVRLTNDVAAIDVHFNNPVGGTVDNVVVKFGPGRNLNGTAADYTDKSLVIGGYEQATFIGAGHWQLSATLTNVPEGLHLVKARLFNQRPAGFPALFQTFSETVYVDRHGPDLDVANPPNGSTVDGDIVALINNPDRTAHQVECNVDGSAFAPATEVQKGVWKFNLAGLSAGPHTLNVRAFEADWGSPRTNIRTSTVARAFAVDTAGPAVAISFLGINRGIGSNIELPFFRTIVTPANAKLYWDGYELPVAGGTNVFDGRYIIAGVTNRLWGAFINGTHFFEAVAVSGGQTNRDTQQVTFNLYGVNETDSDGDGLPDNVEMPNFHVGTSPGPNIPWPGDTSGAGNQDMIPNYGENWTRLNPMNADTDYDGLWDADEDSDNNINSGDGVLNGCEVRQGYFLNGNPYHYNIYNGGSKPTDCTEPDSGGGNIPSQASWTPTNPTRCAGNTLTITYAPNQGPLSNAFPIQVHIGHNGFSNVTDQTMSLIGDNQWQYVFPIPTNATVVDFVFRNTAGTVYDNNGGADWHVNVGPCVVIASYFDMNGDFDSAGYEVANLSPGMKIHAAVKGDNLYVATWSANGGSSDHFLYVTDKFAPPQAAPWAKAGNVFFDKTAKPFLAGESAPSNGYHSFVNSGTGGRSAMGTNNKALEGEINLTQVFGYTPDTIYLAVGAYGDNDGDGITTGGNVNNPRNQCPATWFDNNDLEIVEFLAVPIASIRDENLDGAFDCGKPQMWTVVNTNTNDANYGLRRFFLDEVLGESASLFVIFQPNAAGVSDVELFTNLNRRDFAVLPGDEDPATVTTNSQTTYYRAYPMPSIGGGQYSATLPVNRCGVYRLNARYKVDGQTYYYTDNSLRRDCVAVVSPKKALNLNLYELNPMNAEATSADFFGRSTFEDMYVVNIDRPDTISTNYFPQLAVNMVWLQPIHPIGSDNRETDATTGQAYDPGSPYAVRNYWQVNTVLGDPANTPQALSEFTNLVARLDTAGVGVMLDGTFNHSAWDCEIGEVAVQMFPSWATNATDLIRTVRPQWYSKKGDYGQHASYYQTGQNNDVAQAPDRIEFGKWPDVADFNFGIYDTLEQGQDEAWHYRYLFEQDKLEPLDVYQREVWQYFAYYPRYWLEKTGHPAGTPKDQSHRGIDGLRCDFAQGLPSPFWEYTINKTRQLKWDFIFMAESLDGYNTVNGSNRHGLSYRSARQFDVLNENLVFYWRDQFFSYFNYPGANPTTFPTFQAFDGRRDAYDLCPLLLNLTGHDELLPQDDQWRILYAYSIHRRDGRRADDLLRPGSRPPKRRRHLHRPRHRPAQQLLPL